MSEEKQVSEEKKNADHRKNYGYVYALMSVQLIAGASIFGESKVEIFLWFLIGAIGVLFGFYTAGIHKLTSSHR